MSRNKAPEPRFPIKLTEAQRKAVAKFAPKLADRLKLDEANQRVVEFTLAELKQIETKARTAIEEADTGMLRRPLRHVLDEATTALKLNGETASIPAAERGGCSSSTGPPGPGGCTWPRTPVHRSTAR